MVEIVAAVLSLAWMFWLLWLLWILFAEVGDMAERRKQDRILWQVVSLFITPITAMVLLWLLCTVNEVDD